MANWESLTHEERQAVYDAIQSELDASRDNLKDEPDNEVEREYAELLDSARHKLWPPEPDPAVQAAGAAADDQVENAIARGENPNAEPIDDLDWSDTALADQARASLRHKLWPE